MPLLWLGLPGRGGSVLTLEYAKAILKEAWWVQKKNASQGESSLRYLKCLPYGGNLEAIPYCLECTLKSPRQLFLKSTDLSVASCCHRYTMLVLRNFDPLSSWLVRQLLLVITGLIQALSPSPSSSLISGINLSETRQSSTLQW